MQQETTRFIKEMWNEISDEQNKSRTSNSSG